MATTMDEPVTRRDFSHIAATAFAGIGAAAALWPLVDQMNPDASALSLASVELDLAPIQPGQAVTIMWRGKPIFINHRTKKEIEEAKNVNLASLPDPQPDSARVKAGDDIVELAPFDALRVPGSTPRGMEAGPDGAEILAISAPNTDNKDAEMLQDFWPKDD